MAAENKHNELRKEMTSLFIINVHENVFYLAQIQIELSEGGNLTARDMRWSIDSVHAKLRALARKMAFLIYVFAALITGCSESPYKRAFSDPTYKITEQSAFFKHFVVEHFTSPNSDELHIYIEGDGFPWAGNQPTSDPTPRQPVALEMLYRDSANAIYLGRPCYFNHYASGADTHCDGRQWTNARYSRQIIDDMNAIAAHYIAEKKPRKVVLIGYSGGGVLATMMACSLPPPITLVTVAANLDVEQWTALHDYAPLSLSLNPTTDFVPCKNLSQHHFVGANDDNVPVAVTRAFTDKFKAPLRVLPATNHVCCWSEIWGQLLNEMSARE